MNELVFTPASLLDLLSQVDELKDLDIGISETLDGNIQLQLGNSTYIIGDDAKQISADPDIVEDIADLNTETYDELADSTDFIQDTVESGIVSELAKTLFIGGVARLTAKYLKG